MRVLLIGANGMLGRAVRDLSAAGHELVSPAREQLDITNEAQVREHVTPDTGLVINCAAYTDVDRAESEEALATRVNGYAVGRLASCCAGAGATLVHYSTDYVFDGRASRPYPVDAPRSPLGAYGRSKLLGETLLEQSSATFLLLRTSWLYAPWGKNFVLTMLELMKNRSELSIVDDQLGRPSSALGLAEATWELVERGERGVFHVTDGGQTTWFGLASEIAKQSASKCTVLPCTSDEFPRPAKRPGYSVLDLSKTEAVLGPRPDWQAQLKRTLELCPH